MDVRTLLRRSARFHRDREAIVAGERRLSFGEAWRRGLRLANALLGLGLRPGDRVGVLEDNTLEAADFFLGTAAAGLVRVPLYPRNARPAHVWMLAHTGCRAAVVAERYAADVAGIEREVPGLAPPIVRDRGYEAWLSRHEDRDPEPPLDPASPYVIRHTGGTTGKSKGVAYSHRSWLAAGRDWFYSFPPVRPGDVCLHVGPISHGSGYFFVPTWLSGGVNLLQDHFEAERTLDLMQHERVAYLFAVPTLLNLLARHPSAAGREFPSLKVLQVGGSPITDDTALLARRVFGPVLYQGYGQTEALPITMMGPDEWFGEQPGSTPLRSAGRPLPFAGLEIRGTRNETLPCGETGEIAVRCEGQMTGFWEDPAATAQRLVDGWVLTGDIGRLDENGFLYVLDRKDDMIISGGFNVWPAELENAIQTHPAVVEVAVFGVPDERWGEAPLAVCVIDGRTPVTEKEIVELCRRLLGSYKKPARVLLQTEPLPKSPVGKVQRKLLREPYWRGRDRRVAGS